ncbi:hypothetical protein CEXT_227091 [Caerostris extrusa]|uniref:Uncharacterized protein n=1 Tax=Caerostris extrusa TaxID=172846 RepID=A0AAV4NAC8_CAEEX|nr:hypothetical protein CEXT_227091 [Caerostris extrusa]
MLLQKLSNNVLIQECNESHSQLKKSHPELNCNVNGHFIFITAFLYPDSAATIELFQLTEPFHPTLQENAIRRTFRPSVQRLCPGNRNIFAPSKFGGN